MLSQAELELLCRVSDRGRPPVPDTPLRLAIDMATDADFPQDRLIEQLESDAHLSFGLLSLANLPLLVRARTIRTVRQAVTMLGQRHCRELLWVLALSDVLQLSVPNVPPRSRDRLWRHSLLTGVMTLHLTALFPCNQADAALSAGMAHDLGHLLLNNPAPRLGIVWHSEHDQLPERAPEGIPERDHCRLGGALLEFWNAPAALVATARHHHAPEQATADLLPLVASVRLADLVTESLDADESHRPVRLTAHSQWAQLQSLTPWDQIPDLELRLIELLPEAILQAEHLANLLGRN